jgi:hypothetical protein
MDPCLLLLAVSVSEVFLVRPSNNRRNTAISMTLKSGLFMAQGYRSRVDLSQVIANM